MPAAGNVPSPSGASRRQFIALSDLAHPRLTARDLLPLLPALLISFTFNFGFVLALMLFNENPTAATASKPIGAGLADLSPEVKKGEDDDPLDVKAPSLDSRLDSADEPMRVDFVEQLPGMETLPEVTLPSAAPEAKPGPPIGNDAETGRPSLPGPLLENVIPGFRGEDGVGAPGLGSGMESDGRGKRDGGWDLRGRSPGRAMKEGASTESEQAVTRGLQWLAIHQNPAGFWSLDRYHSGVAGCRCKDLTFEADVQKNDTAATGLALLPFLAAGHTHLKGSEKRVVSNGLKFLLSRQDSKGDLGGGMYAHGIATIALCEAYGMSRDPHLRPAAQNAVRFIVNAQNTREGSWRYMPKYPDGDVSVLGWQVMALRSAQMAGLDVEAKTMDGAIKYLDTCGIDGLSKYGYQPGGAPTPAMTAAALLSRQYLGWGPRNLGMLRGCDFLLQQMPPGQPAPNQRLGPLYFYYYASQVMHNMGDKYWETWNPAMRDFLVHTQEKDGHKAGSWDPDGCDWGKEGGRIYSTSLALLTLEVYYRYLPLYRRENAAKQEGMP